MMKTLLLLFSLALGLQGLHAQAYVDQFDGTNTFMGGSSYTITQANGEVTLRGNGATGQYEAVVYDLMKEGAPVAIDMTSTGKVFLRAKASVIGTQARLDVVDQLGYVTSLRALTQTLTAEYTTLEFDFDGKFVDADGGYGGTPCTSTTAPCDVDGTKITRLFLTVDPGVGEFAGDIIIDYLAFVTDPNAGLGRTVFADQLIGDSARTNFAIFNTAFTSRISGNNEVIISGSGLGGQWDPFAYAFRNQTTYENITVDFAEGNSKLYVKMKSSVPNTSVRIDAQDQDNFITTGASVTELVGTEYAIYEFNYTGGFSDLGYGGTACTRETAPCPVDPTRIVSTVWFVNPGAGAYAGDLTIDWISVGAPLEALGPQLQLTYFDRFNDGNTSQHTDGNGYTNSEANSEWTMTGDGTSGQYATVSYNLHDKDSLKAQSFDLTTSDAKMFIRMKVEGATEAAVRIDLVNKAGFATTLTGATSVVTNEYVVYEYKFKAGKDGGYGGSPCTSETAPCPVTIDSVTNLYFYINAADGGFAGKLIVDYLAFGTELGADPTGEPTGVVNYGDNLNGDASANFQPAGGFTVAGANGVVTVRGDGTAGPYQTITYLVHDADGGPATADAAASGNKVYIRARASVPTDVRFDLKDSRQFATTNAGVRAVIGTEWALYSLDFAGRYQDGGYGGTACTEADKPCAVDAQRIAQIQLYPLDATGGFGGTIDIDYISFGTETVVSVTAPQEVSGVRVFPNPVTEQLNVRYDLVVSADVDVTVYDALGRAVLRQVAGRQSPGNYTSELDLSSSPSGVYQVVLSVDGYVGKSTTVIKR